MPRKKKNWELEWFGIHNPPEAFYFTILREPSDQFESLYGYYNFHLEKRFNMTFPQYVYR